MLNRTKLLLLGVSLLSVSLLSSNFLFADSVNGPQIILSTTVRSVEVGELFKVTVKVDEPLLKFTVNEVSVDGGRLESVRKLSPYSYLLFVRAEESKEVDILVESEKVQNRGKVFNADASNNLIVKVKAKVVTPQVAQPSITKDLSSLLDEVVKAKTTSNVSAPVTNQATQQVSYYNCNGQAIPTTQACNTSAQSLTPMYQPTGYYDAYGNYYTNSPYSTNPYSAYGYGTYSSYSPYSSYSTYSSYSPLRALNNLFNSSRYSSSDNDSDDYDDEEDDEDY